MSTSTDHRTPRSGRSTARRTLAVTATAAVVLASMGSPALAKGKGGENNGNPNTSKKITQAVDVENVWTHLEEFQEIADENGGNRASGLPGYEASAEYVEQVLQDAGYETERHDFSYPRTRTLAEDLTVGGEDVAVIAMSYSPSTPDGGVTGPLAAPTVDPQGCDAAAYGEGGDLTGQIAIVSRGTCAFSAKSLAAAAVGAEAVLVYNNEPGALNGTLGGPDSGFVPAAGMTQEAGQALLAQMAQDTVTATLDLRTIDEVVETFNVLAETSTGRDDNVVMLGAHLDSAQEGAGINDNATGSAAILETAVQLARVNKLNNTVRFAWWGGEEDGLQGSNAWVADQSPAELDDIATYLNFDMVGSPNYVIGVYDADESTYEAGVAPPAGSIQTEEVFTDYFDLTGQPWVDTAYSGRSDYQAFILSGVPASGLFTGADGTKTEKEVELFGGTAGITYDPNYHTVLDDIDNVDREALDIMSDAIAHAALTLAQDTSEINGKRSAGKSGKPHPQGDLPTDDEEAEDAA
ncbi:M28 family peptidase [Ornithinimicrobium sp. W1679]|uniref:M28 family peptidase n=1 Tax=Ornithinimicrobium sp. W1679 TaxID=3418770 RepID=UPI003CEAA09A